MVRIWDILAEVLKLIEKEERKWLSKGNLIHARVISLGAMAVPIYILFIISHVAMKSGGIAALFIPPLFIPILVNIRKHDFAFSTAILNLVNTIWFAWIHISIIEIFCYFTYICFNVYLTGLVIQNYFSSVMINLDINILFLLSIIALAHSIVYFVIRLALLSEDNELASLNKAKWEFRLWSGALVITIVYTALKLNHTINPMDYLYYFFTVLVSAVRVIEGYRKLKRIFSELKIDNEILISFIKTGKLNVVFSGKEKEPHIINGKEEGLKAGM